MYEYKADVTNVIDGDTLELQIDLGFHVRVIERVRLVGLNAPEMKLAEGVAAKDAVVDWLFNNPGPYTIYTIKSKRGDKQEKYGRYLAEIWPTGISTRGSLNNYLLDHGFAAEYNP